MSKENMVHTQWNITWPLKKKTILQYVTAHVNPEDMKLSAISLSQEKDCMIPLNMRYLQYLNQLVKEWKGGYQRLRENGEQILIVQS